MADFPVFTKVEADRILSTVRAIPLGISSEQLMRAVRLFQPYRVKAAADRMEQFLVYFIATPDARAPERVAISPGDGNSHT